MEDGTRSEPAPINAFHKSPAAIIGNGDTMVLPDVPATIFEGEAELALVIGKRASNVKAADAMDYIFGYTNFIDGSARGLPAGGVFPDEVARHLCADRPLHRHQGRDPGPAETADPAVEQRHALMQNFNTSDMAHKIPRCIEWLTSIHTLEPGDIVATGTNHRGLNPFMDGDKIELEIDGLGRLAFNVKDELKRKWDAQDAAAVHEAAAQKTPGAYPDYHAATDRQIRQGGLSRHALSRTERERAPQRRESAASRRSPRALLPGPPPGGPRACDRRSARKG